MPHTLSGLAVERAHSNPPAQLHAATVAAAPAGTTEKLRVVVDGQPGVTRQCAWMPRVVEETDPGTGTVSLQLLVPVKGDRAWVQATGLAEWVVVCWWPS